MWQSSRRRSGGSPLREKRRKNLRHLKMIQGTLKVLADLGADARVFRAKIALNDVKPNGIATFTSEMLPTDLQIAVSFEYPKVFYAKGRVLSSYRAQQDVKLITENSFVYRVQIEWIFASDAEREAVRAFCDFIRASMREQEAA